MHFNETQIINPKGREILVKAIKPLNLINLAQVHLILDHGVPALEYVLLTFVPINLFNNWFALSIILNLSHGAMGLELLQDLLSRENLLNLRIYLGFLVPVEYVIHCLELIIDY